MDVLLTPVVLVTDDFEGLSDRFMLRMYEVIGNEVLADASACRAQTGCSLRSTAGGPFCKRIDWPESNDASKRTQGR